MVAIGFDCSCGLITFDRCLKECPQGSRCLSRPTLKELSKVREWSGKPSVTQLLKGTREALLEIACEFYINPKDRAFTLLGTAHHSKLESNDDSTELVEIFLEGEYYKGTFDYYSSIDKELIDYKTLGSYKAGQVMGMDYELVDDPTGELYKIGEKKGQIKQVKKWFANPEKQDAGDYNLQINAYRRLIETQLGLDVDRQRMQVTIRDGGTRTAEDRGVTEKMFIIDIPKLPNEEVDEYFKRKSLDLKFALESGYCPKCTDVESWEGRKCADYCDVAQFCAQMGG